VDALSSLPVSTTSADADVHGSQAFSCAIEYCAQPKGTQGLTNGKPMVGGFSGTDFQ
jgi:hypothetical protein